MHAYSDIYLEDAMRNLGQACDYAALDLGVEFPRFWEMFTAHPLARSFAAGRPFVVSGMSGCELATNVLASNGYGSSCKANPTPVYDFTCEYWCGWVLAYWQWATGHDFSALAEFTRPEQVMRMYPTYHEMPEDSFLRDVEAMAHTQLKRGSRLKACRLRRGLTQRELAVAAGISLRTLQHYECRDKDINKAQVTTALALARALSCNVEDLLEPTTTYGYAVMNF